MNEETLKTMEVRERKRQELIEEIQKWSFAAIELTLFLDTHPRSREALRDYNEVSARLMELHQEYTKRYSPLVGFGHAKSDYPWAWAEGPWPWESGI